MTLKICYIAHPISGDIDANLADIRRIVKKLNEPEYGIVPFVPYYADVVSLDDSNPKDRAKGIANDHRILESGIVQELWLTGPRISEGMAAERDIARKMGLKIVDFTGLL